MNRNALWIGLAVVALIVVAGAAGISLNRRTKPSAMSPLVAPQPTFTPTAAAVVEPVSAVTDQSPEHNSEFVQLVAEDADLFNPVLTTSATSVAVIDLIYPRLLGRDAQTGILTPTELATGWDISPDGRIYTFTLRSDVFWSDGQPVTSADFRYTYEALRAQSVQIPVRDRLHAIAQIDTPTPYSLVLRLAEPDCAVLHSLRLPLLPSHRYAQDYADLQSNSLNMRPEVSAGPFLFSEWKPNDTIVLQRNPDYWKGAPRIARTIFRIEPDAQTRLKIMAEGDADLVQLTADDMPDVENMLPQTIRIIPYPAPAIQFLALNLANPQNPQPGQDEAGNPVLQDPHPILADKTVREAIAQGIDYNRMLLEVFDGRGSAPSSYIPPSIPWAYSAAQPARSYRPVEAAAALQSAGWIDIDDDGVREKDGARLSLTLLTNQENPARLQAADLIAQNLGELGFAVPTVMQPFEQVASTVMSQQYDMALLEWDNVPADPGILPLWSNAADAPGTGPNFTSFQDTEVDAWVNEAKTLPGCDLDQRGELYRSVQGRVYDAVPYVYLHRDVEAWAVDAKWAGINPGTWGRGNEVQQWQQAQ